MALKRAYGPYTILYWEYNRIWHMGSFAGFLCSGQVGLNPPALAETFPAGLEEKSYGIHRTEPEDCFHQEIPSGLLFRALQGLF